MKLLTQNQKMKKSSRYGITVVNWTLPAFQSETGFKTCPMAKNCVSGCYARSGTYRFKSSVSAHNFKLELSQSDKFISEMISEIETWLKKRSVEHLKVRIHDAGDFYDLSYFEKWITIMKHFENNENVSFYAYTKMVQMVKSYQNDKGLPASFRVIYSFGGKQDHLIDTTKDFHSMVFESLDDLNAARYVDGTQDDLVAAIGPVNRIGLVYHGAKNFVNTNWKKVS